MPEMYEEIERMTDDRDFWFTMVDIRVMQDRSLSIGCKGIYSVLCSFASTHGRICFPKVKTIAETAGCSERTVQESLKRLEAAGYIERKERFRGNKQVSSEYTLVGHKAPERGAEYAPVDGGVQNLHPRGAKNVPPELEPRELYKPKTYSPSESTEESVPDTQPVIEDEPQAPEEDAPLCSPEDAPAPMGATVDYFLLKTGRSGISAAELSAVRALEKRHTPARIQTEIGKAVARYQKAGKPLASLSLEYIWEALKHQTSLPGARKAKAEQKRRVEEDTSEKQRLADLEDWERRQHEELMAKYGGEDV